MSAERVQTNTKNKMNVSGDLEPNESCAEVEENHDK
jgi:hypothetical protein